MMRTVLPRNDGAGSAASAEADVRTKESRMNARIHPPYRNARARSIQRSVQRNSARRGTLSCRNKAEVSMLRWALIFLLLGLIAAALGFTGVAGASVGIAKVLFFIFLAICVVMFVLGLTVYRGVRGP